MLKLNQEYTYKKICEELGWKESSGGQKQKQIKEIESSFEFYHPENKKTHKPKKSYIFTKQLKEPEIIDRRKNNGSKKLFPDEDFMYLFKYIVSEGFSRNEYHQRGKMFDIYITKGLIYKSFGFNVYYVFDKITFEESFPKVNMLFRSICLDAVKANTVSRICKMLHYPKNSLPKGILVKQSENSSHTVPKDELLPDYNEYMKVLLDMYDCVSEAVAVRKNYYSVFTGMISDVYKQEGIYGVKRVNLIRINADMFKGQKKFKRDSRLRTQLQSKMRDIILSSILKTIENRCVSTKQYSLELTIEEKRLMIGYFSQMMELLYCEDDDFIKRIETMNHKLDEEEKAISKENQEVVNAAEATDP